MPMPSDQARPDTDEVRAVLHGLVRQGVDYASVAWGTRWTLRSRDLREIHWTTVGVSSRGRWGHASDFGRGADLASLAARAMEVARASAACAPEAFTPARVARSPRPGHERPPSEPMAAWPGANGWEVVERRSLTFGLMDTEGREVSDGLRVTVLRSPDTGLEVWLPEGMELRAVEPISYPHTPLGQPASGPERTPPAGLHGPTRRAQVVMGPHAFAPVVATLVRAMAASDVAGLGVWRSGWAPVFDPGDLGVREIGPDELTIVYDPTLGGARPLVTWDDEGVETCSRPILERGVVRSWPAARWSVGLVEGAEIMGCAFGGTGGLPKGVALPARVEAPGRGPDLHGLVGGVEDGLLVDGCLDLVCDDRLTRCALRPAQGFEIRRGRVTGPVPGITLWFSPIDLFGRLVELGGPGTVRVAPAPTGRARVPLVRCPAALFEQVGVWS